MKILMFGAGVVGNLYGWALTRAGHDVKLLVKPSNRARFEDGPIKINIIDARTSNHTQLSDEFSPVLVETFCPNDHYDLIIVTVKHYQTTEALPALKQNAGKALLLFLCNHWDDLDEIKRHLGERYILGSPRSGGSFDNHTITGGLTPDITLGEPSGELTDRIKQVAGLFKQAGFKPCVERDIVRWLYVSFAQNCAMVGASTKARGYQNLASDPAAIRDLYDATRDALAIVRGRGFDPTWVGQAKPFYTIPKWLFVPLFRKLATREEILAMADGHARHAPAEMKRIYYDVLNTGERLGIATPALKRYKSFIDEL
jgi:2-dehydropantoate 2-reductase